MVPILSSRSASQAMISQSNPAERSVPRRYDSAWMPSVWSRKVARSFHVGTWFEPEIGGAQTGRSENGKRRLGARELV